MARLLAVDDEPLVRRAVGRVMGRLGHVVAEAGDVATAPRMAQEHAYDVAFVDYDVPGGPDGLAVLGKLRELSPRCVRILMTGRTDFPAVIQAITQGEVLRVLPKPFNAEQLQDVLRDGVAAARRPPHGRHRRRRTRREWRRSALPGARGRRARGARGPADRRELGPRADPRGGMPPP